MDHPTPPVQCLPRSESRAAALATSLALLALVAFLDWASGPNFDFSLFYLAPVCFVTWRAGTRCGYLTSLASAALWLVVDRLTGARPSSPLVLAWNFSTRLAFFSGSVLLLAGWKRAGKELAAKVEQRTAALRRLASQLSAAEEAERRRLAYDMHDGLSQTLSMIRIELDAAQLDAADRPAVQRRLAECGATVEGVIQQTRTLMFDLYPAMLDDLGLVPTLEWYARQLEQRTGADIVVSEQGACATMPTALTNYLFRAVKELLGNAVRHGRAREIIVLVHWEPESLRLVVDDDGQGFDVGAVRQPERRRGLGLPGISERLQSMGGRLHLESNPGAGSRAILEVPLAAEALDNAKDQADDRHEFASAAG